MRESFERNVRRAWIAGGTSVAAIVGVAVASCTGSFEESSAPQTEKVSEAQVEAVPEVEQESLMDGLARMMKPSTSDELRPDQ